MKEQNFVASDFCFLFLTVVTVELDGVGGSSVITVSPHASLLIILGKVWAYVAF